MTDTKQSTPSSTGGPVGRDLPRREADAVPEAEVATSRGISMVWLAPLVAAVIGIWLAYTTLQERGPTITITFDTAEGLEAGKTKVKYKDVEVGTVDQVRISEDLKQIVVTAEMTKGAEGYLAEGTRFWVVSPRLGAGGVSGLGTLVSGVYIGIDPKQGELVDTFAGLDEPPLITSDTPGRQYVLHAETLGSISRGSPVYFRGIDVGQVVDYALADDDLSLDITVFVRAPHDQLVQEGTRFWNASGFRASIGTSGVQVETESVQSLLTGGVAFDTPISAGRGEPSAENTVFSLYDSFESVTAAGFTQKIPYTVYFEDSVRGLNPGAPVEFKGIQVGTVKDVKLQINAAENRIRIPVTIEIEPERMTITDAANEAPNVMMAAMVERGLRAQLQSANMLTGQLLVDLGFHPKSPPAQLGHEGPYPEIPSVPSELEALTASVSGVLNELASLPLGDLVQDLRNTVQALNRLASSPKAEDTLEAVSVSATALQTLLGKLDQQLGPLISQARGTLAAADDLVGSESPMRYDLNATLKELAGAARSIRVFADYLERHPDALLRGRSGLANQ